MPQPRQPSKRTTRYLAGVVDVSCLVELRLVAAR